MVKNRYNIDRELIKYTRVKPPRNIHLYAIVNLVLRSYKCKSDKNVKVAKKSFPGYRGEILKGYLIEPKQYSGDIPCIMFYHGGGLLLKASGAHYKTAKEYVKEANCKVFFPDYRLMLKHGYPVPFEDCYYAYKWILDNSKELNIDTDKMVVAGDSVGGYLAAVVSMMLKERDYIVPTGALMTYPVIDYRMKTESMIKFTDTPIWDSKRNKMFWNAYLKDVDKEEMKYVSLTEEVTKDFPKAYIETAEFDCLHDEGVEFAERLKEIGIPIDYYDIKNSCHGYENAYESKIMRESIGRRIQWLHSLFAK